MRVTASAISLNVDDVDASAAFIQEHFGFRQEMAADGFAAVTRDDVGFNVAFLRTGLASFQPAALAGHRADGLLVAFVVDDIDAEYERLQSEGIAITTPLQTEPWSERFFQVTDPNGVVLQLVPCIEVPEPASYAAPAVGYPPVGGSVCPAGGQTEPSTRR